jgi:predicted  nucleic acid-binding Zn-ribbon protein
MKTYKWHKDSSPEDLKQRTIIASEEVTEMKKEKFTLAQKEEELENAKKSVLDAQKRVKDLEAEIAEIKTTLKIK